MVLKNPDQYQKGRTIVYFVRHGDRLVPQDIRKMNNFPGPGLNKLGKKQAKAVAKEFAKLKDEIDVFISSGMTRALETAEEIGKKINKKPKICNELCEFNKFVWEGKFHKLNFWKHYFKHRLSIKAFDRILLNNKGKVIVIVAHGNIIKGILGKKIGIPLKQRGLLDCHNCHICLARFIGTKLDYIPYINSSNLMRRY